MAAQQRGAMSPATARRLAALIVADAEQLQERAADHGVTAFVGRALQRERPNERFLQSTIRNLASANRRKDERAMWAAWEAEQQQQQSERQQDRRHREGGRQESTGRSRHRRSRSSSRDRSRGRGPSSSRSPGVQRSRQRGRSRSNRDEGRSVGRRRRSASRSSSRSWSEVPDHEPVEDGRAAADASAAAPGDRCQPPGAASRSTDGTTSSGNSSSDAAADDDAHPGDEAAAAAAADAAGASSDAERDEQLVQWLASSRAVRGRGSVGPRADMPGPFLQAPEDPQQQQHQGVAKGPARPAWLPQQEPGVRLAPDAGFLRGVLRAQGLAGAAAAAGDKQGSRQDGEQRRKSRPRASGITASSDSDGGSRRERRGKRKKDKKKEKRSKHKKHKKQRRKD